MKLLAYALVLATVCPAWSQSLDQKITFSSPATTTKALLATLSKQTGVELLVSGAAAEEIVAVHVKGAVLNDVLKRIAEVSTCEWKEEGGAYRLVTSNNARLIEARKERDARTAELKKEFAERVKALQPAKPDAEEVDAFPSFFGGGGGAESKAVTRLLAGLDLSLLADLRPGQRVVFSSMPNRMQRPLGRDATAIITQYVAEHNVAAKQMQAMRDPGAMSDEERQAMEFASKFMGQQNKVVTGTPYKALVVASKQELIGSLTVEIRVYDREGKVMLSGNDSLGFGGSFMADVMESVTPPKDGEKPPVDPDPTPIKFSKVAQELGGMFGGFAMGGGVNQRLSKDARERVLHPDQFDPLSLVPSETLIAIAEAKGVHMVANIPDSLASPMRAMNAQANVTVGRALQAMLSGKDTQGEIKDGWLILRPAYPDENRRIRVPRDALAKLLQAGDSKGVPSLDDIAAYAGVAQPPMETPAAMMALSLFAPNAMQNGISGLADWTMLRFYGTLTPGQRESLGRGAATPLPNLSIPQRDLVMAMAYGASAKLRVGPAKPSEGGFMDMMQMFMPGRTDDFREEPTELMPNGLPAAGDLRMDLVLDPIAVLAQVPDGAGGLEESSILRGALGADELALFEFFKQDPNFAAVGNQMPQLGAVRVGQRKNMKFTFALGPNVFMDRNLNDDAYDPSAQPVSIDNLPQAFRDRISKRVEAFKKSPLPFLGGMGSGPPPPPPGG